jgi:putative nucleotidyltransferase with HDIG domain
MGREPLTCSRCGRREPKLERVVRGLCLRCRALALVDGLEDSLAGHTRRVTHLATLVADQLGVSAEVRRDVEVGGLLHDVGKLAVPARILAKAGPLDDDETAIMRTHVVAGEELAAGVEAIPPSVPVVVRASHERWDGDGYPDGLAADRIPLAARIVSIADALDAMTSSRSYRAALPIDFALQVIRVEAGRQFDPAAAEALVEVVAQWGPELASEPMATAFEETLRRLKRFEREESRAVT